MLAMQDKPGLIQDSAHPDRRTTINQRNEEVNLLPTTHIIVPIELLPSQMTKSQATMVNEATCSTNAVDSLNSNTNTNTNINTNTNSNLSTNTVTNSMSALANDSNNQISSSRPQSLHSNNAHVTVDTNNGPSSLPPPSSPPTSNEQSAAPLPAYAINGSSSIPGNQHAYQHVIRPAVPKRTANDYRFGKTIGEGSFSSVYIAQDIHTKREVASK